MKVSAKAEYACLALLDLALLQSRPEPVRVADIADRNGIPERFLVQILLQLKGAGYVQSTRGAAGGYQLAVDPAEITLWHVFQLIDGPSARGGGNLTAHAGTGRSVLHQTWQQIDQIEEEHLRKINFAELVRQAHQRDELMFHI